MVDLQLLPEQQEIAASSIEGFTFLEGPAGCGKTTAAAARLLHLLYQGVPAHSILLLLPQRTLAQPFLDALRKDGSIPGSVLQPLTFGGIARRMVDLFFPMVAEDAGFTRPDQPPVFLTIETAQYIMASLVRPLIEQGMFSSLSIERNRLYSQILDNLNKAALSLFPHTQIGERLVGAWFGEPGQANIYHDAQHCANLFRQYCLDHNLLDYSLQMEVFHHHLWQLPLCRDFLMNTYRHLVYDNVEEDTPFAHDMLREWLPNLVSALLVYDHDAGYRSFLGASPQHALLLKEDCNRQVTFNRSLVSPPTLHALEGQLARVLNRPAAGYAEPVQIDELQQVFLFPNVNLRYYPQTLDWAAQEAANLVNAGTPPAQIVILAPFFSDSLRFSLADRLDSLAIPWRTHRPSRPLRHEPAASCLLSLAKLAHPSWGFCPPAAEVTQTLFQVIDGMDLVRAQLLTEVTYRSRGGMPSLSSFEQIEQPEMQERITYTLGTRFDALRAWLEDYALSTPLELDFFFSAIFGEVLSQPGYGFHVNLDAGRITASLIESVSKFRRVAADLLQDTAIPLGKQYIEMVTDGVIAAQYLGAWNAPQRQAILLAPAYTFLMSNQPVDYQFWLDLGNPGWSERLNQPLTHPYVLSQEWPIGQKWDSADEQETSRDHLYRLALGLMRRCRRGIYLGASELSEGGYEQRGDMLRAVYRMLQLSYAGEHD